MKTTLKKSGDPLAAAADVLVVPVTAPGDGLTGAAADLDAALGGLVARCVADRELEASAGSAVTIHTREAVRARRVVVVSAGDGSVDDWRTAGRAAGGRAGALRAGTVAVATGDADAERVAAFVVGFGYGEYRFDRYRTGEAGSRPRVTALAVHSAVVAPAVVQRAAAVADAVAEARDLVNTPGNDLTPPVLAERAVDLAAGIPGLECEVLGEDELRGMGAGALLSVARGSVEPPRMIVLRYTPARDAAKGEVLGLVGKAVTFDTGGISIKPSGGMEEMKMDMGGGAAVLAGIALIARRKVPVNVVAVIPSAENMPSGSATKPGDVVRAMNGTTIEVTNTDAEGRLILADALVHATTNLGATRLVDFATLTGAIVVAIGEVYAGLFGSDDAWRETVRAAGDATGDLCWPMPMHPGYAPLIASKVADLSNSSPKRQAGAVYAAQFLREFTDGRPWCHVDIAGTGMIGGAGTGFGVALSLAVAEGLAAG